MPKKAGLYHYMLFLLITISVGISSGWNFNFRITKNDIALDLNTVRSVFPISNNFIETRENVFRILSGSDSLGIGVLVKGQMGYGGKVPLFIGLVGDTIKKIKLMSNDETQEFLNYISDDRLLDRLENININQLSKKEIDAVSGATETSNAIIGGIRQGAAYYLNEGQSIQKLDFYKILKDFLFLTVIVLALLMTYTKNLKKYRWVYLVLLFLVMGLYIGKILSLKLLYGWLSNGIAWHTNWQSTVLLILALLMPLLKRPKFYCNYLCPMGAFQELINKLSPVKKRNINLRKSAFSLSEIYLTLILVSLVLGFEIELSYLEPFMVFMYKVAGTGLFVFATVIAVMSLFFNKPWCTFCPTGCLINKVHNK